ncbi:MAG TPA: hypothetical protein VGZ29_13955 [Terriglobia bacterium]|nr:hypothetical protein [Terriglobia bacterium]
MAASAEAGTPDQGQTRGKRALPGEEMACLDIAVGILGVLLLIFPALTSFRGSSIGFIAAGVALMVGLVLAITGGFMGLSERRQRPAGRAMKASGLVLTVTAVILLGASSNGLISWDFPVGALFLTLGLFADLAAWRFRRALRTI